MIGKPAPLFGGIEAGGTKFVLGVGSAPDRIVSRHVIATGEVGETLALAADWLAGRGELAAIGIATFGPADIEFTSSTWGHILGTPKPGWSDCDLAGYFTQRFGIPVGFDTDVNGAALGEYHYGAGNNSGPLAYVTVGTGIGGGLVIEERALHGAGHPEMGHLFPRRTAGDFDFAGHCPIHGDCLEGLASGPAILARWGKTLSELPADHLAHELVAGYLAQLCNTIFATCAARTIVLGGGVMQTNGLLDRVREQTFNLGSNYFPGSAEQTIVAPALGHDSGLTGALILAREASRKEPM